MIRMPHDRKDDCSPDTLGIPYICLIAVVAVLVGVALAWIG